jgi:hypothetical protein
MRMLLLNTPNGSSNWKTGIWDAEAVKLGSMHVEDFFQSTIQQARNIYISWQMVNRTDESIIYSYTIVHL